MLRPGLKGATLEASWRNWEAQSTAVIRRMQELETENNRLFIAAYGGNIDFGKIYFATEQHGKQGRFVFFRVLSVSFRG